MGYASKLDAPCLNYPKHMTILNEFANVVKMCIWQFYTRWLSLKTSNVIQINLIMFILYNKNILNQQIILKMECKK